MSPTERQRRTNRRKRLAHLGVGGVIVAAASVRLATAEDTAPSTPVPVAAAPVASDFVDVPPPPARASRSQVRPVHHHKARPAPRPTHHTVVATSAGLGWPWPELAQCEADGHWSEVTGNGFLWGLQFTAGTWDAYRGALPSAESFEARGTAPTPLEQVTVARKVQADQGWAAWPACSARLGLR